MTQNAFDYLIGELTKLTTEDEGLNDGLITVNLTSGITYQATIFDFLSDNYENGLITFAACGDEAGQMVAFDTDSIVSIEY